MPEQKQSYAIPIAIVVAGLLVAGSVLWGRPSSGLPSPVLQGEAPQPMLTTAKLIENMPASGATDHRIGSPSAPVTVVEYSDIECPFCRRFHDTMNSVMAEYGAQGKVAWVYRHFPLDSHPKAYPEALASECVAAQSGETNFWKFIGALMETTVGEDGVPVAVISDTLSAEERVVTAATKLKLDSERIASCVSAETYKQKIADSRKEGSAAGLGQNQTGTPYSVIFAGEKRYFIDGAQPLEAVKSLIDNALAQ